MKELYAFVSWAYAYPTTYSSLVDSYNTKESGIKNFLLVSLVLSDHGFSPTSIRLDSGDLSELSKFARDLFKEVGDRFGKDFSGIKIVASNDLNEKAINLLNERGHEIDILGIGTNLVTCQDQPALGMVYKLCEFMNTPRIKISEEPGKSTLPGRKVILRNYNADGTPTFDVLCLAGENPETISVAFNRITGEKTKTGRLEVLTDLIFENGKITKPNAPLSERRETVMAQLKEFGGAKVLLEKSSCRVY